MGRVGVHGDWRTKGWGGGRNEELRVGWGIWRTNGWVGYMEN